MAARRLQLWIGDSRAQAGRRLRHSQRRFSAGLPADGVRGCGKDSCMALRLGKYSYRFAEQVLNSKLALKQEIDEILTDATIDVASLSRPAFNRALNERFAARGWQTQPL